MTADSTFDVLADAWSDLQRAYWDALSALAASEPTADCEEAVERQVLLFERIGGAILRLRTACIRAGLSGLEQGGEALQLSRDQLDEFRSNTEGWIANEKRALAGWVEAARALCQGTACSDSPAPTVTAGTNGADRLLDLQSICLEALRPAAHGGSCWKGSVPAVDGEPAPPEPS